MGLSIKDVRWGKGGGICQKPDKNGQEIGGKGGGVYKKSDVRKEKKLFHFFIISFILEIFHLYIKNRFTQIFQNIIY